MRIIQLKSKGLRVGLQLADCRLKGVELIVQVCYLLRGRRGRILGRLELSSESRYLGHCRLSGCYGRVLLRSQVGYLILKRGYTGGRGRQCSRLRL